jgi:phosphoribosylformylglycinamidine synthase subunit PurQ / glutaminase
MADVTVGVVVFPGSNCDHDTEYAVGSFSGIKPVCSGIMIMISRG